MPNRAGDYYVINLRQKNKGNQIKVERFTTSLYFCRKCVQLVYYSVV